MADLNLILAGAVLALGAGVGAAQLSAPLATDWRARKGAMKRRLLTLSTAQPGRSRRFLGAAVLAATLTGGALAAYAAQPSAPERLAAQAAGVVGSGDHLALRLVEGKQQRTLKPGDDYADGWKLDALTPTSATLIKDGERRQVGLNPAGALASVAPAASPSQVQVTRSDAEFLDLAIRAGLWDGKTPRPGLTLAETQRYMVLWTKGMDGRAAYGRAMNDEAKRAGFPGASLVISDNSLDIAALGAEGPEYIDLLNKETLAKRDLAAAAYQRYGAVEVPRPPGPYDPQTRSRLDALYPGAKWTVRGGDPVVDVITPPDPAQYKLLSPADVKSLDETARFLDPNTAPGGPVKVVPVFWR